MSQEPAIALDNISKVYKRYNRPIDRLKEALLPHKSRAEEFWALRDINLEIQKGETVGIIGRNGSGKSTLLQIIAGTLQPSSGEVNVRGRVSALLELGSGFNPEFTGRQNVFFNGRILGLSTEEVESKFDDIASFADIGEFIEQPVKTYSSGMFVRLAFAVAVHVNPEVFIVDEALAVGDVVFQHKCMRRIKHLMDSGVTTLFVSHDASAVKTLCNYAFMLEGGKVRASGVPNDVFIEYMKLVTQIELEQAQHEIDKSQSLVEDGAALSDGATKSQGLKDEFSLNPSRRGSGKAKIVDVKLLHEDGSVAISSPAFTFNEEVTLVADIKVDTLLEDFIFGFYICDKNGNEILGSNTKEEGSQIGKLTEGQKVSVSFSFRLCLRPGGYSLTVAGAESYNSATCDWLDNVIVFKVLPPSNGKLIAAFVDVPMNVGIDIAIDDGEDEDMSDVAGYQANLV